MATLRKVLCPVDFSAATERQVRLAADLCRSFQARLALHHNVVELAPGAGVGWMYAADHHAAWSEDTIQRNLSDLTARVAPGLEIETHITRGPSSQSIIAISRAIDADLVIVSTHGASSDDHASVTERVLASGHRAVLVLHDAGADVQTPHFVLAGLERQIVLVPTDLTADSRGAVLSALDLADTLSFEVHLVHLRSRAAKTDAGEHALIAEAQRQVEMMVAPTNSRRRVFVHVEYGDAAKGIVRLAAQLPASCIVMGEHTRAPIRRWFSRDTSRAVLHQAPCPVWYVPASRAGATEMLRPA